ncbi:hypothetical protein HII31_02943 [Pseudocercospora fuligena]|uniref:Uncharacterized protein n=1 Tax=Pseudocercospora fuligena TaxID=685502 RepID=A0A8H6VL08_9PEZI|nr:hypothetical protein HII31_02943 [Pseudocercospora fuligena]
MAKLKSDLESAQRDKRFRLSRIKSLRQQLQEEKAKAEALKEDKAALVNERDSALRDATAKERIVKAAEHVTKCNAGKHWEEYGRRMAALKEAINGDEE